MTQQETMTALRDASAERGCAVHDAAMAGKVAARQLALTAA